MPLNLVHTELRNGVNWTFTFTSACCRCAVSRGTGGGKRIISWVSLYMLWFKFICDLSLLNQLNVFPLIQIMIMSLTPWKIQTCLKSFKPKYIKLNHKFIIYTVNALISTRGPYLIFLRQEGGTNSKRVAYLKGGPYFVYQFLVSKWHNLYF